MIVQCDSCNAENTFISNIKSRRCYQCRHPLDRRLKVKCPECGVTNHLNRKECRGARCSQCYAFIRSNDEGYVPNRISLQDRATYLMLACICIATSIYALINQHLVLPYGGKRRGSFYYFDGYEITLPLISLVLAIIGLLAAFTDHYDDRENEHVYRAIRRYSLGLAYLLYMIGLAFGHRL